MMNGDTASKTMNSVQNVQEQHGGKATFFFSFWFSDDKSCTTAARYSKFSMDTEHTHI
jgi:hypothetical protein